MYSEESTGYIAVPMYDCTHTQYGALILNEVHIFKSNSVSRDITHLHRTYTQLSVSTIKIPFCSTMYYKGCEIFFFFVYLQFDGGIQQDEVTLKPFLKEICQTTRTTFKSLFMKNFNTSIRRNTIQLKH